MMELRNRNGEMVKLADNLTLREMVDMGLSIDICDKAIDPNEHWTIEGQPFDEEMNRHES